MRREGGDRSGMGGDQEADYSRSGLSTLSILHDPLHLILVLMSTVMGDYRVVINDGHPTGVSIPV